MTSTRIALVGGRRPPPPGLLPTWVVLAHFPSTRDGGQGDLRRLRATLLSGTIEGVLLRVRFLGHDMSAVARRLGRKQGLPVLTVTTGQSGVLAAVTTLGGHLGHLGELTPLSEGVAP